MFYVHLPADSPYRSALSEAVLRLQEQGVLTSLKRKWWKEKRGGGACSVSIWSYSFQCRLFRPRFRPSRLSSGCNGVTDIFSHIHYLFLFGQHLLLPFPHPEHDGGGRSTCARASKRWWRLRTAHCWLRRRPVRQLLRDAM